MQRPAARLLVLLLALTGCGGADLPDSARGPAPTTTPAPSTGSVPSETPESTPDPTTAPTPDPSPEPSTAPGVQSKGTSEGSGDDCAPASPKGVSPPLGPARPGKDGTPPVPEASTRADAFVLAALAQRGDPYVFGVEVRLGDPDPDAFDSSELTQWAADQAGASIPDGAMYQYLELKSQGRLVSVEEGIHTRGALLFHFTSEPTAGGGRPSSSHVAISLGDGRTIEARGSSYGVDEFPAVGRFNFAGVIAALDRAAPATRSAPTTRAGSSTMRSLRLGISEIYEAARAAGFTPRQATTWTAIALAESGGETGAIDTAGEQAVGLWRIGVAPGSRTSRWGDLSDPLVNARAAYEISCRGADMRPWSSTHAINAGTSRDYRVFLDDVEAVTGHAGDRRGAENPREKGR